MKSKLYVGIPISDNPSGELFRSPTVPTFDSHGKLYRYVIGPFRTKRGAEWMADPVKGRNNPHCRCVADAEKLAKKYANI
jgi:hypothetical protein